MFYEVWFFRKLGEKETAVQICGPVRSLTLAASKRVVSGDLVVYEKTCDVVPSKDWLWDWEKNDLNCYAQKAIRG